MDEEFESIVVTDPNLVDEGIDVYSLRTQTDVTPYLLGNIPDYPGIQYEAFNPGRLSDLMRLYSYGLPAIDTSTETPPATGGGSGGGGSGDGSQATLPGFDVNSPKNTFIDESATADEGFIDTIPTTDATMPSMLSPDMGASMVTSPSNTTVLKGDPVINNMEGYLDNITNEELYGITEAEQMPPGGGDPGMFYDAPETYPVEEDGTAASLEAETYLPENYFTQTSAQTFGSIPPGEEGGPGYIEPAESTSLTSSTLQNINDYITLTSAKAPQSTMPQGSPGQLNPFKPQSLADTGLDYLDDVNISQETSAPQVVDVAAAEAAIAKAKEAEQAQLASELQSFAEEPQAVKTILAPDGITYDAVTGQPIFEDLDAQAAATNLDTSGLTNATPEQRNTVQNILTSAGDNVQGALTQLGKIPGAIVDFANQTVDVFGKKLNVGKTLASIALNKIAGGPVSLVFDVLSAILPKDTLENRTTRSIVDELKAEKDYGFNMQSGNLNQDPFGRNPVSGFGDYEQTLKNDILGIDQSGFQTAEMTEKKKEFAKDYFNKKAIKAGGFDPNNEGTVLGPGEAPGEVVTLDDLLQEQRDEKIDAGIQAADDDKDSNIDTFDTTPSDQNIIERGGGDDIGTGGLDPNRRQQVDRESSGDKDEVGITVTRDTPKESTYDAEREDDRDVGKIVCTMMNESYGFGSFRNKIWMKFHKDLSPEYQKGYHKLFLPLVRIAKTNKVVKKVLEHIAVHSTIDMRQATRGKTHLLGRVYRKILLPLCYWVGKNG